MVIVKVHRGKNGRAMIDYPLKDKEYNDENNPRVIKVTGVNVRSVKTAKQEMVDVWKYYGKDNGNYIQAQHIIQSFSNDEADPNNEIDILCAHSTGRELALRLYPEQQAIVVTHADNTDNGTKKATVHNHIIVNNVNSETGKSLRGENVGFHRNVAKVNDEIAKELGYREAINQIPSWENSKKRKERKRNKSDEIIAGVKAVLDKKQVTTMDEYVGALGEFGISVKHKGKRGQNLTHITYNTGETMTQNPGDSRGHGVRANSLAKRNGKVDLFSRDALMKIFEENEKELERKQRKRKEKIRMEREKQEKIKRDRENAQRMNGERLAREILDTMLANAKAEKLKASKAEQKPVVEAITTKPVAKKSVDEVVKQKPIVEPIKTKPVAKVVEQKPVVEAVAKVAEQKPVVEVDEETKARNARIAEVERQIEERERKRQEIIKKRREERAARSKTRSKEKKNDGLSK